MVSLLFLTGCSIRSKVITSIQQVDIYNYFDTMGYTTSGAYGKYSEFDNKKTKTLEVSTEDCEKIYSIISRTKPVKCWPAKLGIKNVFLKVKTPIGELKVVICSICDVIDLTNMIGYYVRDEKDVEWLRQFIVNQSERFNDKDKF